MADNLDDSSDDLDIVIDDERMQDEELIRYYFNRGFTYVEICLFLSKNHGIDISQSTLKRRLKSLGLRRRNSEYDLPLLRDAVRIIIDGPDSCRGYRSKWHTLQLDGIRVPRFVVQQLVKELDPDGVRERRAHRMKRRTYQNTGPDDAWHCDGYDKLKPFGFPIHGCIDGWSRKIIWLHLTRSNNLPSNIAMYYLEAVDEMGGCPVDLITDLGTENGMIAGIQAFFRDDADRYYVPSPRNQRIECWWSFLRKSHTSWWINFFKDLCDSGVVDLTNQIEKECLWFCFAGLIQQNLNDVKEHWNTHYIRKSKFDTIKGRPDSLYYLPELHGGVNNLLLPVPDNEKNFAKQHIVANDEPNEYYSYFTYVTRICGLEQPTDWKEGLKLYHMLIHYAKN